MFRSEHNDEVEVESFLEAHGKKIFLAAMVIIPCALYLFAFHSGDSMKDRVSAAQFELMLMNSTPDEVRTTMERDPDQVVGEGSDLRWIYATENLDVRVKDPYNDKFVSHIEVVFGGEGGASSLVSFKHEE